jgi:aryl-alcohol dehydrogenase-like predicted oxidoreductase
MSAGLIETSLAASLRRLRTDYIDVLALHDPTVEEVCDPDILTSLRRTVDHGHVRALSVTGSLDVVLKASTYSNTFQLVQVKNDPFSRNVEGLRAVLPSQMTIVSFGIFGHEGHLKKVTSQLKRNEDLRRDLHSLGYDQASPHEAAKAFLLDYAFASNAAGVTLASMYTRSHLAENTSHAAKPVNPALLPFASRGDWLMDR